MHKAGFIGLGTMGTPMAWNIHRAGFALGVYNRSPGKAQQFAQRGVDVFQTPAGLAGWADTVIIMVFGPEALMQVLTGPDGVTQADLSGKIVINMSTVSRGATLDAAAAVAGRGAEFLDAPVSGSKKPAEDGTLSILAGGSTGVIARARPLLDCMGSTVIHCGEAGAGTDMKLVINLLLGTLMQSFAEALVMGAKSGLRPEDMLEAVRSSAVSCPMFSVKGAAIRSNNFEKNFPVELIFKDLNLALQAAGRERISLPAAAAAREAFGEAMARGLAGEDLCAVVKVLEELAGVRVRGE